MLENLLQLLQPPKFDRILLTYVSPFPVFKKVVYNRYTPFSDTSTSSVFVSGAAGLDQSHRFREIPMCELFARYIF